MSPGIIGMYWLLACFATAVAWCTIASHIKRATHNTTARCWCWDCTR